MLFTLCMSFNLFEAYSPRVFSDIARIAVLIDKLCVVMLFYALHAIKLFP